jgi:hypothetical protein
LIIDAAAKAVIKLQSLPIGQKETFASGFVKLTTKLYARTDEFIASHKAMPAEMPDPLPQPNVLFKKKRNRGYIGAKAAEENKKNAYCAQKQAKRNAKDRQREGD